jgi:hypothetical protein
MIVRRPRGENDDVIRPLRERAAFLNLNLVFCFLVDLSEASDEVDYLLACRLRNSPSEGVRLTSVGMRA